MGICIFLALRLQPVALWQVCLIYKMAEENYGCLENLSFLALYIWLIHEVLLLVADDTYI
jgi:hypothetical protein